VSSIDPPSFHGSAMERTALEAPPIALTMFASDYPNQFIGRDSDAPAEPVQRKPGRSLALSLRSRRFGVLKDV